MNLWAGEMRQYNESIERRLDKHGLLDRPEDRDETLNDGETKGYENEYYRITVGPDVDDDADDNE